MADTKISALTTLADASLAAGDYFVVVDVSDTSMAASGTTKKIAASGVVPTAGTWTPAITGSAGDPTITYTTQLGSYLSMDTWIFFTIEITINTISGGSGTTRISLPVAPTTSRAVFAETSGADFTAGTQSFFRPQIGVLYGILASAGDNVSETAITVTSLAAGDIIQIQGFYEA